MLNNRQIAGSLAGLAEIGASHYAGTVESFLNDKVIKIRKTAFLALSRLNEKKAYQFALNHLNSNIAGIRRVVIDFLSGMSENEVMEKARLYFNYGEHEIKKSMLQLFQKVGGMEVIADLMLGTINEDEEIRQLSCIYLDVWRAKAARLFTAPARKDIERAEAVYKLAFGVHEHNKYFPENPLKNLNFYFG